ncbi:MULTISPECIES: malonic semialdehyde reductase [Acetobacter]|uniref:Malonic semialdehyde reductase n=2 Tax=Acetobacter TaxID=434 RepID=A0AAN1PJ46_9PROT|nr:MULTISPECIES: malonic semialdehyde reductase [Acetobacter]ASL39003.1 malonic semialdehyde reductase [Acetobacter oryzifermentans]AXN01130.1 malonic semialdehyde reductase [Acetobacter pomorum]KAA8396481.1 malonic semialdehyde reductase [Acetobacter sp. DmW_125124]KAA8398874.1 malonic semialdehyde reductase [Acetobacter sp. DmW_125128]KAA8401241.1 malonic semialdehyde reductase [Acetobacter sp. DmW_125127]
MPALSMIDARQGKIHMLDENGLDLLFRKARTPLRWTTRTIEEDVLRQLYDLTKFGPTSGNCSPARFVFITGSDGREKLRPALSAGNVNRVMGAPVIAIVAHDPLFFEQLPRLCPQENLRSWFASDVGLAEETAFRNGTLQGAYMIMAARALGVDALPISGFDQALVEDAFLAEQGWRANFLLCLGYGDFENQPPRAPRLAFEEACCVVS